MPEHKKKLPLFGHEVEVADVPIKKASEYFNEYELEDGSVLRVKSVATSILRIEGQFTPEPDSKPIYIVLTGPVVRVVSSKLAPQSAAKLESNVKPS
ncbi:MAG: hypothetical protein ABSB82_06720 [Terriglobia bacterium]|jgi:hypothetical protein